MTTQHERGRGVAGIRWKAGFVTGVLWVGGVTVLALAVGFLAKSQTRTIDEPVFARIRRAGTNSWTDVLTTLTRMGNVPQTQKLAAVLAVVLAVWLWRRGQRWWMPLLVLPLTWVVSRACQFGLAKIVDRDRDAISLIGTHVGAYPSGGVMRIIAVTGSAVVVAAHYGAWSRRTRGWAFLVVAVLGLAEAYFRARLNQHWFTDVLSGVLVGWLFVAAVAATVRAFDPVPGEPVRAPAPDEPVGAASTGSTPSASGAGG